MIFISKYMVLILIYVYIHVEDTHCCPQLTFEVFDVGAISKLCCTTVSGNTFSECFILLISGSPSVRVISQVLKLWEQPLS